MWIVHVVGPAVLVVGCGGIATLAVTINKRRRRTNKVARGDVSVAEGVVVVSLFPRRSRSVVTVAQVIVVVVVAAVTKEERDTVEDSDLAIMQRALLFFFIVKASLEPVWLFRDVLSVTVVIHNRIFCSCEVFVQMLVSIV